MVKDRSRLAGGWILAASAVAAAIFLAVHAPIPQDPNYHRFADQRGFWIVPRAGDVLSNAAFLLAGAAGLLVLARRSWAAAFRQRSERLPYLVFFAGVFLTGFGSAWYHLSPDTHRLFWDRLPMTIAFLSLLTALVSERLDPDLGKRLLWPSIAFGAATVLYWRATEEAGHGDLRPYAFAQYYPVFAIFLLLTFFPSRYTRSGVFWGVAGLYLAAKLLEVNDAAIFHFTGTVSGHTLKHLAAAGAAGLLAWMLATRHPVEEPMERRNADEP